jgi:hypothetical protein
MIMRRPEINPLILAAILTLTAAGCAARVTPPPVPPPVAETVPKPPVSGQAQVWRPGYYDWNGSGYVWTPGVWVPAQGAGRTWIYGAWVIGPNGGYVWQPAHWGA